MVKPHRRCPAGVAWVAWTFDQSPIISSKMRLRAVNAHQKKMQVSRKPSVRRKPVRLAPPHSSVTAIRLSAEIRRSVDEWASAQTDNPSRSEAIRRLIVLGLVGQIPRRHTQKAISAASEMAGRAIDLLSDRSAPIEERESRKRRLVKGPKEFREFRDDLPKSKA
jgi:hypothetical protein